MQIFSSQEKNNSAPSKVDRITTRLDFNTFFGDYALLNRPFLIDIDLCSQKTWRCLKEWSTANNSIDTQALIDEFDGERCVCPISHCNVENRSNVDESGQTRSEMTLKDYLTSPGTPWSYLKDWHMQREFS